VIKTGVGNERKAFPDLIRSEWHSKEKASNVSLVESAGACIRIASSPSVPSRNNRCDCGPIFPLVCHELERWKDALR
jgi:hypothetical protein